MQQVLNDLIKKGKQECANAQRECAACCNGLGGISILTGNFDDAGAHVAFISLWWPRAFLLTFPCQSFTTRLPLLFGMQIKTCFLLIRSKSCTRVEASCFASLKTTLRLRGTMQVLGESTQVQHRLVPLVLVLALVQVLVLIRRFSVHLWTLNEPNVRP